MASWINPFQEWLSEGDALKNAQLATNRLLKKNWSKKSICAVLGNMRHESSMNPNMYEYGYAWGADRGFGLVQWTPRSKYWNWAVQNGYKESKLRNGDAQMDRIDYEAKQGIQWISTPNYPESFATFRKNGNNKSLDYLTEAFTWNYERPLASAGYQSMSERKSFAHKCYDKLDFSGAGSGSDDDDDGGSDGGSSGGNNPLDILKNAFTAMIDQLEEWLQWDMHSVGNDKFFSNNYFSLTKTFNNTYRLQYNNDFLSEMRKKIESIGGSSGGSSGGNDGGSSGNDGDYNTCDIKSHNLNFRYAKTAADFPPGYPFPSANGHHGNDYNYVNEPLKSPVSGTVNGNGNHGYTVNDGGIGYNGDGMGWGNRIVIKLDDGSGRSLLFAHLSRMDVKAGDKVKVGQVIGMTGNTGEMTSGAHLHLELKDAKNSNSASDGTIDPTGFVNKHCGK